MKIGYVTTTTPIIEKGLMMTKSLVPVAETKKVEILARKGHEYIVQDINTPSSKPYKVSIFNVIEGNK